MDSVERPLNLCESKRQMKKILARSLWAKLLRSWELGTGFVGDMSSWLSQKDKGFLGPVAWRRTFYKEQASCPKKGLVWQLRNGSMGRWWWACPKGEASKSASGAHSPVLKLTTPVPGLPRKACPSLCSFISHAGDSCEQELPLTRTAPWGKKVLQRTWMGVRDLFIVTTFSDSRGLLGTLIQGDWKVTAEPSHP